jgi:hypothetical protein
MPELSCKTGSQAVTVKVVMQTGSQAATEAGIVKAGWR